MPGRARPPRHRATGCIMAEGEYQVVFRGELTGEHPAETVKQQLADLFGMPTQRIDALFSGKPVVVKKNVDRRTAERFDQTFRKAGAICEIRGPEGTEAGGDDPGGPAPPTASAPAAGAEESGDERETGATGDGRGETGPAASTSSTAAAGDPNGTVVALDVPRSFEGLEIDDSDSPLAPTASPEAPRIDTAELSLADADSGPLHQGERPPPADIDTSGLSMESLDDA